MWLLYMQANPSLAWPPWNFSCSVADLSNLHKFTCTMNCIRGFRLQNCCSHVHAFILICLIYVTYMSITVWRCTNIFNKLHAESVMSPDGHCWGSSPGTLSCRQVSATHLKIGHLSMKSTGARSLNVLEWLDLKYGTGIVVSVMATRVTCPIV